MVLAVLVAVASLAQPVSAATLKVPMDRFREAVRPIGTGGALVTPGKVSFSQSAPTLWIGYYKLRLPVGTRLSGVSYYHKGGVVGTSASLVRSRFGEEVVSLANATSTDSSGQVIEVPLAWEPGKSRKVRRGYTYYLAIVVGDGCSVHGAKVAY